LFAAGDRRSPLADARGRTACVQICSANLSNPVSFHVRGFESALRSPLLERFVERTTRHDGERDCSGRGTGPHPSLALGAALHASRFAPQICRTQSRFMFSGSNPGRAPRADSSVLRRELAMNIGGERGLLALTPLAGVRLRPLGHLSGGRNHRGRRGIWQKAGEPGRSAGGRQTGRLSRALPLGSSAVASSAARPFLMRSKISSR
jgi:hypothetical protein